MSTDKSSIVIRSISKADDPEMGLLIREVLEEMQAPKVGTAYADPYLLDLHSYYQKPGRAYYVLTKGDKIVGGGGYGNLPGAPETVCEIQKMYFHKSVRGLGLGRELLEFLIRAASEAGYTKAYIETLPQMQSAITLYEKIGFQPLDYPLGGTGHTSCPIHLILEI